jgi:Fe-S cluster assembly protein SufB
MIESSNNIPNKDIKILMNQPYKYGFITDIEKDIIEKGLTEDVIHLISEKKKMNLIFY